MLRGSAEAHTLDTNLPNQDLLRHLLLCLQGLLPALDYDVNSLRSALDRARKLACPG